MTEDKEVEPSLKDMFMGLGVLLALGYYGVPFVWSLFFPPEPIPQIETLTAQQYRENLSVKQRQRLMEHIAEENSIAEIDAFRSCVGEQVWHETSRLMTFFTDACVEEAKNTPDRLAARIDALDGPDFAYPARSFCKDLVRDLLLAPASAKFEPLNFVRAGIRVRAIAAHLTYRRRTYMVLCFELTIFAISNMLGQAIDMHSTIGLFTA